MLNFKRMTILNFLDLLGFYCSPVEKTKIDELNIVTLEDLENYIKSSSETPHDYLSYCYNAIIKELSKIEKKYNYESDNSMFSDLSIIDFEDLQETEKNTLVKDLIIERIASEYNNVTFLPIVNISMEDIRLFFHYKDNNDKLLIKRVRKLGDKSIQNLINGIKFYEEQILRQSQIEHSPGTDLFTMDREKKKPIVEEEILSYIEYLHQYANTCIWGDVSEYQTQLMYRAFSNNDVRDMKNRERIINTFTNYLTLPELEDGVVKNKTLDRFIIR